MRLYTCGITPYDATHLGHARTYVAVDVLTRTLLDAGHAVQSVQNVTDVDDPLLERAVATGQDWRELAQAETQRYRDDMAALRVLPPDHLVGVVEHVELIAEAVAQLRAQGSTYALGLDHYLQADADRWIERVEQDAAGSVSHLDAGQRLEIFAERGGDPQRPGKKHPLDQLLWRGAAAVAAGQDDDHSAWETSMGWGRPGWHIECAVLSRHYLGEQVDVLAGGADLSFPHHEMSQSCLRAITGNDVDAHAVMHVGMLGLDGHKMSKSLGNLIKVADLRADGVDPMVIRLALLAAHYRQPYEWSAHDLPRAQQRWHQWQQAFALPSALAAGPVVRQMRQALREDLDTPAALAAVDQWAQLSLAAQSGQGGGGGADRQVYDPQAPAQMVAAVDALLGARAAAA